MNNYEILQEKKYVLYKHTKVSPLDNLEKPTRRILQIRYLNEDAQDDVKRTETLFHFVISTLREVNWTVGA